jgi:hypothetical protein
MSKPKKPKNKSNIKNKSKLPVSSQVTPRDKEKYPALNFKRQVKLRRDYFEGIEEYVDQLSDKEKDWLNRFLEETVVTNFQHKGPLIYKTKKARREFYNANNARNRCTFTKAAAMGTLTSYETIAALEHLIDNKDGLNTPNDIEDAMIASIELKRSGVLEDQLKEADENLTAHAEMIRWLLENGELEDTKLTKNKKKSR